MRAILAPTRFLQMPQLRVARARPAIVIFLCWSVTVAYSTKPGILGLSVQAGIVGQERSSTFVRTNFGRTPGLQRMQQDCRFYPAWFVMMKSWRARSGM